MDKDKTVFSFSCERGEDVARQHDTALPQPQRLNGSCFPVLTSCFKKKIK
jgi:hypothetical protein